MTYWPDLQFSPKCLAGSVEKNISAVGTHCGSPAGTLTTIVTFPNLGSIPDVAFI